MSGRTQRLDAALVARGLARSRTQAKALVLDGRVAVDGDVAVKVSVTVSSGQSLEVSAESTGGDTDWITAGWVGRGAVKLAHALALWGPEGLHVEGRRCLDVGASTGGFTQVLLEHGAAHVVALDVGHGQLDPRVARRFEVTEWSGTNIKDVVPDTLGGCFGVLVGDLSFISLRAVLPVLPALLEPQAEVVLLVKPQFEVGAARLGRTGVVRSAQQRQDVLTRITQSARDHGLVTFGVARSPLRGGSGNIEYLLWLRPQRHGMMDWGLPSQEVLARCASLRLEELR